MAGRVCRGYSTWVIEPSSNEKVQRLRELIRQSMIDAIMSQAEPALTPTWARNSRLRFDLGAVVSLLARFGAYGVKKEGRIRGFRLGRLRFDPNLSVWSWFLLVIAAFFLGGIFVLVMFVVIPNVLALLRESMGP
jgi:VIT1/CCC1 family predicted Fe2+/Mn2+ transporter